jgi:NADPH-dependent glutamate synthase beta subunit-like oxidoreductase
MATINDGELYVMIRGASEDQLRRGLAAARASFQDSGVSPADAFAALADREAMFNGADRPMTEENILRVAAFDTAAEAAMTAAGVGPDALTDFASYADVRAFYDDDEEMPNGPHYEIAVVGSDASADTYPGLL